MRVAIAGGSGFVGRHVVEALRAAGHTARVLARGVDPADDRQGVEHRAADLGAGPLSASLLGGCDAIVNLVGIKAARGNNGFQRAHVDVVQHLVDAARAAEIERFVHVSVAQADDAMGPYAQSKRAGERLATDSGLAVTILRPGLVYGPGDDALRNLVQMVAAAPLVPVPMGATGPLPAIDVLDVAAAVVATLERPDTAGQAIDLVGPEVLDLRGLVRRVADALALPTATPPLPHALARIGATVMERALSNPPLTRSQLSMLSRGLPGDPTQAPQRLGVSPRRLGADRIREVARQVPPLLPSLRLVTSAGHRDWVRERAAAMRGWPLVLALAMMAMLALPSVLPQVWSRMAVVNAVFLVGMLAAMRGAWTPLLRPRPRLLGLGFGVAVVLYLGADVFMAGLRAAAPALALQVQEVYAWSEQATPAVRLALLPLIVLGEDLLWRGALTMPLCARLGPAAGCLAAGTVFAVAHLTTGPPLLVIAALAMGTLWSALAIRTRSLVPVVVSHLAWDMAVMFVRPL